MEGLHSGQSTGSSFQKSLDRFSTALLFLVSTQYFLLRWACSWWLVFELPRLPVIGRVLGTLILNGFVFVLAALVFVFLAAVGLRLQIILHYVSIYTQVPVFHYILTFLCLSALAYLITRYHRLREIKTFRDAFADSEIFNVCVSVVYLVAYCLLFTLLAHVQVLDTGWISLIYLPAGVIFMAFSLPVALMWFHCGFSKRLMLSWLFLTCTLISAVYLIVNNISAHPWIVTSINVYFKSLTADFIILSNGEIQSYSHLVLIDYKYTFRALKMLVALYSSGVASYFIIAHKKLTLLHFFMMWAIIFYYAYTFVTIAHELYVLLSFITNPFLSAWMTALGPGGGSASNETANGISSIENKPLVQDATNEKPTPAVQDSKQTATEREEVIPTEQKSPSGDSCETISQSASQSSTVETCEVMSFPEVILPPPPGMCGEGMPDNEVPLEEVISGLCLQHNLLHCTTHGTVMSEIEARSIHLSDGHSEDGTTTCHCTCETVQIKDSCEKDKNDIPDSVKDTKKDSTLCNESISDTHTNSALCVEPVDNEPDDSSCTDEEPLTPTNDSEPDERPLTQENEIAEPETAAAPAESDEVMLTDQSVKSSATPEHSGNDYIPFPAFVVPLGSSAVTCMFYGKWIGLTVLVIIITWFCISGVYPGEQFSIILPSTNQKGVTQNCQESVILGEVCRTPIGTKVELHRALAPIGEWHPLCTYLGVSEAKLNAIQNSNKEYTMKKWECLSAFVDLGKGTACWERVVAVVWAPPFENRRLAQEISEQYLTCKV